jgi:prefoldin subunit 5
MGVNDSRASDRLAVLAAERSRVSVILERLEEAIVDLGLAVSLRPDGAARLEKYRQNRQRIRFKLQAIDWEIQELTRELGGDGVATLSDEMLERVQKEKKKKQGWLRS